MKKFIKMLQSLPHWSFIVIAVGSILTILGGYFQFIKELDAAKEAALTEQKRTAEFTALLTRSNSLFESTNEIIKKADETLIGQSDIQLSQTMTLKDLKTQLEKTESILNGQIDLINRQTATLTHLIGSQKIPHLTVAINSIQESPTAYEIDIFLKNNDEYPCRGVELKIIEILPKRHPVRITGRKTDDEIKLEDYETRSQNKPFGKFDIPRFESEHVTTLRRKFQYPYNDASQFTFLVKWNEGSYFVNGTLMINNYIPTFIFDFNTYANKDLLSKMNTNFTFSTNINNASLQQILKNKDIKEAQERHRRELEEQDKLR